jgi:F-type H+-transporting ATPase subunit epsilon
MITADFMTAILRLPLELFHEGSIVKLTARSENGAFGILPNHIDVVIALVPCVLILAEQNGEEQIFGIDEGILVKRGHQVDICVHRAVRGTDFTSLGNTVREAFIDLDEKERVARSALSRLEAEMVRHFMILQEHRG